MRDRLSKVKWISREVFTGQTYTVELEVTEGPVGVAQKSVCNNYV